MEPVVSALTLAAAVSAGVVAGIWFTFSNFVMPALAALPASHGAAAMRAINVAVLNRGFFLLFFGTAALSLALVGAAALDWSRPGAPLLVVGGLAYLVGCIGVTVARNVPLNQRLAGADGEAEAFWRRYIDDWTFWNSARGWATGAASAAFAGALIAS